jgi:hypothetical protein
MAAFRLGWALGRPKDHAYAVRLLKRSVRERDPNYVVKNGWVVRRLGPHCSRIELAQFPKHRDEKAILKAMGQETANLHPGSPNQRAKVLRDLGERKPGWLHAAAQAMAKATEQDRPALKGPRSFTRTETDLPVLGLPTTRQVPSGKDLWAAVRPSGLNTSPDAVRCPLSSLPYQEARTCSSA